MLRTSCVSFGCTLFPNFRSTTGTEGPTSAQQGKVLNIAEVTDYREGEIVLSTLYLYEETGERNGRIEGKWKKVHELTKTEKLLASGY